MSKILLSALLIFFCGKIVAQNKAQQNIIAIDTARTGTHSSVISGSALKLNILAPLLGYSQLSFEKSVTARGRIEIGVGIIGAGRNLNIQPHFNIGLDRFAPYRYRSGRRNQSGGYLELGYKFMILTNTKRFSQNGLIKANRFEGSYIKPSFLIGAYKFNQFGNDSTAATIRRHHSFGALMVNVGHEFQCGRRTIFDFYMGGGAEIDNVKDGDDLYGHPFVLAVAKDNPSVNFAFTAGFRLGYLLK